MRCRFGLLITAILASHAFAATPEVRVFWAKDISDYDPAAPGEELFLFFGIAPMGAFPETYSLTNFVFPAGSDSGIYSVSAQGPMAAWTVTVTTTNILLDGSASPLAPGTGAGYVALYSHFTHTQLAAATALGIDSQGNPVTFPSPQVEVPAPVPPVPLLRILLTNEQLAVSADALAPGYHYTLQSGPAPLTLTNTASFWATNTCAELLAVNAPANTPGQFYRLSSP